MDILAIAGGGTSLMVVSAISAYRRNRKPTPKPGKAAAPRTIDPQKYGLVPREQLVLAGTESAPELTAALDAARAGDWRPAAAYLAGGGGDWNLRWTRYYPFSTLAAEDDGWLRSWRAEQPDSPDAALVHVSGLVELAWNIRSGALASQVSSEQFEGFHRVLREAEAAAAEATRLAPTGDPNPYVAQIPIAMGMGWSNENFRLLWNEITARDPYHCSAHASALQYWCAKWRGSHQLMHAFIDDAIAKAPAGSLLAPMKLVAIREQFIRDDELMTAFERPEVGVALTAAVADIAAADPDHQRIRSSRGIVAYVLVKHGRPAEAVEQFRALGPFVPSPWQELKDPVAVYVSHRTDAVLAALDAGVKLV